MSDLTLITCVSIIAVAWFAFFMIYGRSWHTSAGVIIALIITFFMFDYQPIYLICSLIIPLFSLLLIDVHIILSKPKFTGWVSYANILITSMLFAVYVYNAKDLFKDDSVIESIFGFILFSILTIAFGKLLVSNVILLLINRLYVKEKQALNVNIIHYYFKGGRHKDYYAITEGLGTVEISGFLYLYLQNKSFKPEENLVMNIKTGCLGVKYISGFPKPLIR